MLARAYVYRGIEAKRRFDFRQIAVQVSTEGAFQ
jgi:hypothetical protein